MYVEIQSGCEDNGDVPIFISDVDYEGRLVDPGWIEAVTPIANPLRGLARRHLRDVRLVSELAETSVHSLNARHGSDLGQRPSSRIYVDAAWRALDWSAGGRRRRIGLEVQLTEAMMACLKDPADVAMALEERDLLGKLESRLEEAGLDDVHLLMQLKLADAEDMIEEVFGAAPNTQKRNTLLQRWKRTMQRTLKAL